MKISSCSKEYPKSFRPETSLSDDGFPEHIRRWDGRYVICRNVGMDNRFVVPYSPYLTHMFRAHIHMEVCALLHGIKYVYKCVYKGSDRARLRLSRAGGETGVHDESAKYIDARYACALEAIHRVFGSKAAAERVRRATTNSSPRFPERFLQRRCGGAGPSGRVYPLQHANSLLP